MFSSRVTIGSFRWAGCHESLSHTSQSKDWSQDVTSVPHFFVLTELQGGSFMIFSVIYDMFFRSNYLLFLWGTKREKKDLSKKLHMRFTCVMTWQCSCPSFQKKKDLHVQWTYCSIAVHCFWPVDQEKAYFKKSLPLP